MTMQKVKGQCFECYDNAAFQYHGQTKGFNPNQVQADYVKGLQEPVTTVECVSCGAVKEYTKKDGKWKGEIK